MTGQTKIKVVKAKDKLMRIVAIIAIVLVLGTLVTLSFLRENLQNDTIRQRQKAASLEQDNAILEEKIDDLPNIEGVEQVAQDELGLVYPDTVIFGSDAE